MQRTALDAVFESAKKDERIVFVGSDLGPGVLDEFKRQIPDRFFMEGVSEANVIGMAAGLAMDGYIPFINTIATFLTRRCFEQIATDLCMHNLPVRLIGNGGGLVYAPLGATHMATEDIAIMRSLPNMTVIAPADVSEVDRLIPQTVDHKGPVYIRLARGSGQVVSNGGDDFAIGKAMVLREPGDILLIGAGVMVERCLQAADILGRDGIDCGVLNVHTIKPIDSACLSEKTMGVRLVVTVEEHTLVGGLGSAVLEMLADLNDGGRIPPIKRFGLPDAFSNHYGSQDELIEMFGLTPEKLANSIAAVFRNIASQDNS